jgi:hypothetical protein
MGPRLDGLRVQRQSPLEEADGLVLVFTLRPECGAPPENVVERIGGSFGRAASANTSSKLSAFAIRLVISFCRAKRSPMSRSNRSAHRCASVAASIS